MDRRPNPFLSSPGSTVTSVTSIRVSQWTHTRADTHTVTLALKPHFLSQERVGENTAVCPSVIYILIQILCYCATTYSLISSIALILILLKDSRTALYILRKIGKH